MSAWPSPAAARSALASGLQLDRAAERSATSSDLPVGGRPPPPTELPAEDERRPLPGGQRRRWRRGAPRLVGRPRGSLSAAQPDLDRPARPRMHRAGRTARSSSRSASRAAPARARPAAPARYDVPVRIVVKRGDRGRRRAASARVAVAIPAGAAQGALHHRRGGHRRAGRPRRGFEIEVGLGRPAGGARAARGAAQMADRR